MAVIDFFRRIAGGVQVIRRICTHPLVAQRPFGFLSALNRLVRWQISGRLLGFPVVYSFVDSSVLVVNRGMTGATGNIYTGLFEVNEMAFLLHSIRRQDVFIDVGANVGVYSVLASAVVGARTYAYEPLPSTFNYLSQNIVVNKISDLVCLRNVGVSSLPGSLFFSTKFDTMNHVVDAGSTDDCLEVPVVTLDGDLTSIGFDSPLILKIDVEGHELNVLRGAVGLLGSRPTVAVILETNESGLRYGVRDEELFGFLKNLGFVACSYNGVSRRLVQGLVLGEQKNTIFIKNLDFFLERIDSARQFFVNDWTRI